MNVGAENPLAFAGTAFAAQFGQTVSDKATDSRYECAMDMGDFDHAEELTRRHGNPWVRLTRMSFIRSRQGKLQESLAFVNRAGDAASTLIERSDHLANLAHYSIMMGDLSKAADLGVQAILMDPGAVGGAVNATCAVSLRRSHHDLSQLMNLLSNRAPGVFHRTHWKERWMNDPQLAFARRVVHMPTTPV